MIRVINLIKETIDYLNNQLSLQRINPQRISNYLDSKSRLLLVIGMQIEQEEKAMKLKLSKELRARLIQLAALLLADASDGTLDAADQVSTSMITIGQEIRKQNGLPPL